MEVTNVWRAHDTGRRILSPSATSILAQSYCNLWHKATAGMGTSKRIERFLYCDPLKTQAHCATANKSSGRRQTNELAAQLYAELHVCCIYGLSPLSHACILRKPVCCCEDFPGKRDLN